MFLSLLFLTNFYKLLIWPDFCNLSDRKTKPISPNLLDSSTQPLMIYDNVFLLTQLLSLAPASSSHVVAGRWHKRKSGLSTQLWRPASFIPPRTECVGRGLKYS